MVGGPLSAASQFGLTSGSAGLSSALGASDAPVQAVTAPGSSTKRWQPTHQLFYVAVGGLVGLGLFGYATEKGIGVSGKAHAGPASAAADVQID
jgi:hypothetical protein